MLVGLLMIPVIVGGGSDLTPSLVASAVGEAAADRAGLRVLSFEERDPAEDSARTSAMLACGRDAACIARALASKDDTLSLVVVINAEIDPPLLGLILVGSGRVAGEAYEEVPRGGDALREVIAARVAEMLERQGYEKSARITVTVDPPRAELKLDGTIDPDPGTGTVFTVRAGSHVLVARYPGYADASRELLVAPGEKRTIELELEEEATSPWLYVGAIVVAIVAGTSIAAIAATTGGSSGSCACVTTKDGSSCALCR